MNAKEVWRLVSERPEIPDPEEFEVVSASKPDQVQLNAMPVISRSSLKFVPHALLRPPNGVPTRAFRFVYPTLLVAAAESLLLWDVRTGKLVENMNEITTHIPHPGPNLGGICYVEVNDKYAFVCGDRTFKVFQRKTQNAGLNPSNNSNPNPQTTAHCVMTISQTQLRDRGRWVVRLGYVQPEDLPEDFNRSRVRMVTTRRPTWPSEDIIFMDQSSDDDMDDVDIRSDITEVISDEGGVHNALLRTNRVRMWRTSGKAVVSHETEVTETKRSWGLRDPITKCCVAGEG
jgi:hypothetical protein